MGFWYESAPHSPAQNQNIIVDLPKPGERVSSPLKITGQAKGNWFFEASFPIELLDNAGNIIARTHADAKSDWMTTSFVPFEASLRFQKPPTASGLLILKKDNPSGLPQNDEQISIPVVF